MTVDAASPDGLPVTYTAPTASDTVDGSVGVTCSPASGTTFPVGISQVNCTAVDAHGNSSIGSFTVTVNPPPDATIPDIRVPRTVRVKATSRRGAVVTYVVRVSDPDDAISDFDCNHPSGARFPIGVTTVICTAVDTHQNVAAADFKVDVYRDTTGPVIDAPRRISAVATSPRGRRLHFTVRATDPDNPHVVVHCDHRSGSLFRVGRTVVTCWAVDPSGNRTTVRIAVYVAAPPEARRR
jgi:hypothetical protein